MKMEPSQKKSETDSSESKLDQLSNAFLDALNSTDREEQF